MTPESAVKKRIAKVLKAEGVWYCMPIGGAYTKAGVPDYLCCVSGIFLAIEAKAGKGKLTALQEREAGLITTAGGYWVLVDDGAHPPEALPELFGLLRGSRGTS